MPPQTPKQPELKSHTIALMVAVALFFDLVQLALGWVLLGWLVIPIFYLTYIVWFKMHGLNFLSLKRAWAQGTGLFLELITAGIIPAFTFIVLASALGTKIKKISGI